MKELIKQYDEIEDRMAHATTSAQLSQAEREGGLVIQEICLVAPRIHEAMMQSSRQRRYELSHGIAFGYTPEEKVGKYTKATIGIEEKSVEKPVEKYAQDIDVLSTTEEKSVEKPVEKYAQDIDVLSTTEKKPVKKKTARKKKTVKKVE
jgi:hypothetical protein